MAIASRHVHPGDVPASARVASPTKFKPSIQKTTSTTTLPPGPSKLKRTLAEAGFEKVATSSSSAPRFIPENVEEEPAEEEPRDEMYCTMTTNVVGIQYYKGVCV